MNFANILKSIYQKTKLPPEEVIDNSVCITMNKWMARDKNLLPHIKKILPFLFNIDPLYYYYLLYLTIPKSYNTPFFKKIDKIKEKENKLLDKIQYVLEWPKKEIEYNKTILEKTILKNKKYWESELGLK